MSFASCAQDLDSGEDTSADPILAADAGITPSGLVGTCLTDFAASFPRTREVRRSAVRRTSQKRQKANFALSPFYVVEGIEAHPIHRKFIAFSKLPGKGGELYATSRRRKEYEARRS
jgi:hypothetical protein